MKKILSKIKRTIFLTMLTVFVFSGKNFGVSELLYGVPETEKVQSTGEKILNLLKIIGIPSIIVIGLIVYLVKSKPKKRDIIILLISIMMIVLPFILKGIGVLK